MYVLVTILNIGESTASLEILYHHGGGYIAATYELLPSATIEWDDVAVSLFGVTDNSAGAVDVRSNVPVIVSARTYNQPGVETYGQYLPGLTVEESLIPSQSGVLPSLKSTEDPSSTVSGAISGISGSSAECFQ